MRKAACNPSDENFRTHRSMVASPTSPSRSATPAPLQVGQISKSTLVGSMAKAASAAGALLAAVATTPWGKGIGVLVMVGVPTAEWLASLDAMNAEAKSPNPDTVPSDAAPPPGADGAEDGRESGEPVSQRIESHESSPSEDDPYSAVSEILSGSLESK